MTTEPILNEQDEQDLASAEVSPNSDQYDGIELRRAIAKIIERHTLRCTCGNPYAGNPKVGEAIHRFDGTPCYVQMQASTPVVPDNPLKLSIATKVDTDFGDHGERVTTFYEADSTETVEEMVYRLFPALTDNWRKHNPTDEITLKVMLNKDGTTSGEVPLGSGLPPF
jgi:hypothetical protein